jgi:hypothetical protein
MLPLLPLRGQLIQLALDSTNEEFRSITSLLDHCDKSPRSKECAKSVGDTKKRESGRFFSTERVSLSRFPLR